MQMYTIPVTNDKSILRIIYTMFHKQLLIYVYTPLMV